MPLYRFEKGRRPGCDVVPKTKSLTPAQWDAWIDKIKKDKERLNGDMQKAKEELERMNVDVVAALPTIGVDSVTAIESSA